MGQLARQRIWQSKGIGGNERLVLLALADATPDDRYTCYPSVQTLADMADISPRQVQRIVKALKDCGRIDVVLGRGRNHTTRYAVLVGLNAQEYEAAHDELGIPTPKGDIAMSPNIPSESLKGDIKGDVKHDIATSPIPTIKGDILEEKVTYPTIKGDIAVSPEQNEQKKEQKDLHVASDDARAVPVESETKPAPKRRSKPKADDPPAPQVIRTALFDACQIAPTARREIKINAAAKAKELWKAGVKAGKTDDEIAETILYVGSWCRKHAWQCKDGSAPTPALIGDYWRQAIEARPKPATNGAYTNGVALPPFDYSQLDKEQREREERRKIAAERRQAAFRKAGAS